MQMVIHNGTNDDPTGKAGVAHFLEHMICANSGKSLPEMINYFADEGGGFTANTNHYRTCYGFVAPTNSSKFDEFLEFWTNAVVVNPIENFFEREQGIIRSEIARSFPSAQVMQNNQTAHYLMFRGEPFGEAVSALGTKESFDSIKVDDLLLQKQKMYLPQNMDVVCVGGLSLEQVVRKIDNTALSLTKTGCANQLLMKTSIVPSLIQPRFVGECNDRQNMGVANVQKAFMFPGVLSFETAELAARVLSEKLLQSLREDRGLVYSVSAMAESFVGFTLLGLKATGFKNHELSQVEEVISDILETFRQDEDAFREAKHQQLVDYLVMDMNLKSILNNVVKDLVHFRRIKPLSEEVAVYESVEHKELAQFDPYFTPDNMFTYVAHK